MSYNNIMNNISNQEDEDIVLKFKRIIAHEVPLIFVRSNYKKDIVIMLLLGIKQGD